LLEHQCYSKCLRADQECRGPECYCGGAIEGYDDPDTRALCLSEARCLDLCATLPGCVSVDMHKDVDRCFLNEGDFCDKIANEDILSKSDYYTLFYKISDALGRGDWVDDGLLAEGKGPIYEYRRERRLATSIARDWGYSWPKMVRFAPVTARVPGKYRVCLCDSALAGCTRVEDFGVQVGELHVSGVACLVNDTKYRKDGCDNQYHGGLRCGVDTPSFPTFVAGPYMPPMIQEAEVDSLWDFCTGSIPKDMETITLCTALRNFHGALRLDGPDEERLLR
jgi:hypothetical protein